MTKEIFYCLACFSFNNGIALVRERENSYVNTERAYYVNEKFEIEVEDDIYYVDAPWIEPIMRTINMDDYSSLQYFQRVLRNSGIIDKLEEMGINEGDTVNILGFEFDYIR